MFKGFAYFLIILVCLSFLVKRDESSLINPYDFKRELLKDAIVNLINKKREKSNRPLIEVDVKLDSLLVYFHEKHKNKDFSKIRRKLRKGFYLKGIDIGFKNSWFKVAQSNYSTMPVFGRSYFFDTSCQVYKYGTEAALKDTLIKPRPSRLISYKELSKKLILGSYPGKVKRWITNSSVTKIGLYIKVNKRNYPSRVPTVEIMYLLSGNVMPKDLK